MQPHSAKRQQPKRPKAAAQRSKAAATEDIDRTAGWRAGDEVAGRQADEATQTTRSAEGAAAQRQEAAAQRPKAAATEDVNKTAGWRAGDEVAGGQ